MDDRRSATDPPPVVTETHCTYEYDEITGEFKLIDPCTDAGDTVDKCPEPPYRGDGDPQKRNKLRYESCFTTPNAHVWLVERGHGGATYGKVIYKRTSNPTFVRLDGFTGRRDLNHLVIAAIGQQKVRITFDCGRTKYDEECDKTQPMPNDPFDVGDG